MWCPEGKAELTAERVIGGVDVCFSNQPGAKLGSLNGLPWMQNLVWSPVLFKSRVLSLRVPTLLLAVAAVVSDRHAVKEDRRREQGLLWHGWFALLAALSHTCAGTKQLPPVKGMSACPDGNCGVERNDLVLGCIIR